MTRPANNWMQARTPDREIKAHIRTLTHLRTPEKVRNYLRYQYGDRTLPSVEQIARIMAASTPEGKRRYASR